MTHNGTNQAIFQSFLFNLVFFAILAGVGGMYIYPEYNKFSDNKEKFNNIITTNKTLIKDGLTYDNFLEIHKKSDAVSINKKDKQVLLNNILKDFREDDYTQYFSHTGAVYSTFLTTQIAIAKKSRQEQNQTSSSSSISKILPEYTSDSSLNNDSLTDFKFINYVELLLDNFQLSTKDKIGIGELSVYGKEEVKKGEKKATVNPLDGNIYKGNLQLNLVGEKKNIINFIHYLENVGKIKVQDKQVSPIPLNLQRMVMVENKHKVRNNFIDMQNISLGEGDIYNNLIMEIESLEFSEYLDSSDLPTPDGYNIIQLIKKSQGKEGFEINLKLIYYVKGLPTFKIEKYITTLHSRYTTLVKITSEGVSYVTKNRSSLKGSSSISAIGSLNKINRYLKEVKKEIEGIKKVFANKEKVGEIYKSAQEFNSVFEIITDTLIKDLQSVSPSLYNKNKEILINK